MSTPSPPPRRRRIAGERRRPAEETSQLAPPPTSEVPPPSPPPAESEQAPPPPPPPGERPAARPFPRWRFPGALVAALALVTTTLVLGLVAWDYREVRQQERIENVQDDAAAAAERAAVAILSFKHDTLDADLQAASRFLSPVSEDGQPSFREVYTETFNNDVRPRALETKGTVTANVLASAVVTASEERAQILVYVDQTTVSTANGGRPQLALNRTTFDMVNEDGSWLVAGITSY